MSAGGSTGALGPYGQPLRGLSVVIASSTWRQPDCFIKQIFTRLD